MRDQTAPGELERLREFVNTLDVEDGEDALGSRAEAIGWLRKHGMAGGEHSIGAADRERLVAFREALRALLSANNSGEPPPAGALRLLNEQADSAAVGLRFDAEGAALVTRCGGVDAAIARLLAIAHNAMTDGSWARLKACPAEDCRWAFYDRSRNRSGTWCTMGECGNRAKARRYRERHAS